MRRGSEDSFVCFVSPPTNTLSPVLSLLNVREPWKEHLGRADSSICLIVTRGRLRTQLLAAAASEMGVAVIYLLLSLKIYARPTSRSPRVFFAHRDASKEKIKGLFSILLHQAACFSP